MKDVLAQHNAEALNESKQYSYGKWSCDSKIKSKRKKKEKKNSFLYKGKQFAGMKTVFMA